MKKSIYLFCVALVFAACTNEKVVNVTVNNPLAIDRNNEMVEVSMEDITTDLQLPDTAEVIVLDENNQQVPYQTTYDGKLIFPASVKANGLSSYIIKAGTPEIVDVKACGRFYPERLDDIAWENDCAAYRAYGPALQQRGEKAYGYDVFTKSVEEPVVEARYKMELDPVVWARIDSLRKIGKTEEAKLLQNTITYHVDHGNGMDVYNVGPTLGGGASAFYINEEIIYPYCFKTYEILDNGPLRFTVKLVYNPLTVKGDSTIVETRLITLDEGSHLNKTVLTYTNTNEVLPLATGLVLHEEGGGKYIASAADGYIAYADPTNNADAGNGIIYVGAVFPATVNEAKAVMFPKAEADKIGAYGHVLAVSDYQPDAEFVYYWGSGWSKAGFPDMSAWTNYLDEYARKVRNPLTVSVK